MIGVVGSDAQTAKSRLEELGLTVELKYETSDTVEEEHVISQSVKAGTKIDAKSKVTLIISSGQDAITLANYAGKTQSEAQEDLIRQGIQVKVTTKYSDDVETGKVIETNPKAGEKISKSTVVELIVSRGKETKQVTVPQLVGSSQGDAEAALINAGFHYTIVTQEAAGQGGIVINQSLAAGSSVEEGSEITITVGVEPQTPEPQPEPPTEPPTEPDTTEEGG